MKRPLLRLTDAMSGEPIILAAAMVQAVIPLEPAEQQALPGATGKILTGIMQEDEQGNIGAALYVVSDDLELMQDGMHYAGQDLVILPSFNQAGEACRMQINPHQISHILPSPPELQEKNIKAVLGLGNGIQLPLGCGVVEAEQQMAKFLISQEGVKAAKSYEARIRNQII